MDNKNNGGQDEKRQIAEMLKESLEINREMAKSLKFIKTYFRWRSIWNIVKLVILGAIIIFGALSFSTAVEYFQEYTSDLKTYSEQFNKIGNLNNFLDLD